MNKHYKMRLNIINCMKINYTKQTATNQFQSFYNGKQKIQQALHELNQICSLEIIMQPISIAEPYQKLPNYNIQTNIKKSNDRKVLSSKLNRKQRHDQLISQFSSQRSINQITNHHNLPDQKKKLGYIQPSSYIRDKTKANNYPYHETQDTKAQAQNQSKSPHKYLQSSDSINSNHNTRQLNSKQSIMTFSPIKIDICLESIDSQDLNQYKHERQIICQIQNDIKVLIKKIHANHSSQLHPSSIPIPITTPTPKSQAKKKYEGTNKKWKNKK